MIIVADNLHVIDPGIAQALAKDDPEPVRQLVLHCARSGAQAIDINSGPLKRTPEKFAFLVQTVQGAVSLPLLLDTANADALGAGLAVCRSKAIINGFSLEPAKKETILPLAMEHGVDIIGYLLHPDSRVPIEAQEMMALAVELFEAYSRAGLPPERLIIDPVVAPMSWDSGIRHNQAVLSVIRNLPDLLGAPVRTIAGLSNLGSGPVSRQRKIQLECAYLPMLAASGLDMVLMNVLHAETLHLVRVCDALLSQKVFSWTELDPIGIAADP
jgi:5-methyltetrahydrofolate corrinoid/iron sulfur protein methyltransferase